MTRNSKRKLLLMTALFTILLISSAYGSFVPIVNAAELTTQEKGLAISDNVVGLDLTKYATTTKELPQDSYLGVLPQENVRYTLASNGSEVDMRYTFTNGKLQIIHVLESTGSPRLTKTATNTLETAKDFLSSYQSYSGNSFYGELGLTLSKVEAGKNLTQTSGNIKLEATSSEGYETFKWTYTLNGIEAPSKTVSLGYKDGFLKYFVDNWDLYKIGSTSVNLSEPEAIDMAMESARTFSWKMGSGNSTFIVKNFTVTQAMVTQTVFSNFVYADKARNRDPLTLYPMRYMWVSLDKFYPGNVYGIEVYIWADTGEVGNIKERFSTLDPPADQIASFDDFTVEPVDGQASPVDAAQLNAVSVPQMAFPALAAVMLATVPVWFLLGKKKNLTRSRFFKVGGVLLCLLLSSMMLFPILTVNAASPNGRAEIWASESTGAYDSRIPGSWRKTSNEIQMQHTLADMFSDYFRLNGYNASNNGGSNSLKSYILNDISYDEANYPRVAVVDFDHGQGRSDYQGLNEFHFMFEDNVGTATGDLDHIIWVPGNGVYDMDIYPRTALGKVFFAFINTCGSANLTNLETGQPWQGIMPGADRARGMPFAWTHHRPGIDMSANGYDSPDSGDFAYLGFPYGSAALTQGITMGTSTIEYSLWIWKFFQHALEDDISVINALDQASLDWFEVSFASTSLKNGFAANWPIWNGTGWPDKWWNGSTLVVYGNGNLHLYQKGGIWDFNEGQGSIVHDSSAHHNDGTIYGATWATGKLGSALSFDGVNDYVNVPHSDSVSGLSKVTLTLWVKLDALPPAYSVNLAGVLNEYWLEYRDNGYLSLSTYINGGYDGQGFSAYLADGRWHMLAMTYDGTYKKGYLDGQLMATYTIPGTLDDTNNAFQIGASFPASQGYNGSPDGVIDEVRVYDRALSAQEIAAHYAAVTPYYSVSVDAFNEWFSPVHAEVWIDGQWVGWAGSTFIVPQGTHSVYVSSPVYNPEGWTDTFQYFDVNGNVYYDNPVTLQVSSDTAITAIYDAYSWCCIYYWECCMGYEQCCW